MLDERERRQRIEAEYNQLLQHIQQQQRQQPQGPETIFDAPDEYLNQRVIAPLRQGMQMEMMQRTDAQSREFANVQFGEQAVNAALADIAKIRQTPQGDFVFQQIMARGIPTANWSNGITKPARKRRSATIRKRGCDSSNRLGSMIRKYNRRWRNTFASKYAQQQQKNGSGNPPNVSLPPSLSSVPSASGRNVDLGDLSSESLFAHAIK